MISLKDTTFIIPIRCESRDRAWNLQYTVQYLCRHFATNIMILESGKEPIAKTLLTRIAPGDTKIKYRFEKTDDSTFHRTRLLNEMLIECTTKIVVNYDCDILLDPSTYIKACEQIRSGNAHLVYPYFKGESQKKVYRTTLRSNLLEEQKHEPAQSWCGHCQFFDREAYIEGSMENESYMSYGNEDVERMERFQKLGYKVMWLDGCYVYHIEHSRGPNSGKDNPHFEANEHLYKQLSALTPDQLRAHYKVVPYLKKYKKRMITLLTYADGKYKEQQKKITSRALDLGCVDSVIEADKSRIVDSEFYKEHKAILDCPRGAGYWIWKPHLILETLINMPEDDILVYIDSGDLISSSFREFVLRKMRTHDILLTEGSYLCSAYTKRDVFVAMGCDDKKYWDALQVEAGIFVCKKTEATIHVLREWLKWCLTPGLVTDAPSKEKNLPDFIDSRHDQSILSIMRIFHKIECTNEMREFINCNQNK